MILRWLIPLALCLICHGDAAKILGLYPFPARSHLIVQKALVLELARRGHEVTILTPVLEKKPVANLTEIHVIADMQKVTEGQAPKNLFDMSNLRTFDMLMMMLMMGGPLCEAVLQEDNVQKLIHSKNHHFDLVIIEAFTNDCMLGFAHKFNAPVIQVCPFGGSNFMGDWVGSPNPYAYVPDEMLNLRDRMTFSERVLNSAVGLFRHIGRQVIHLPKQDELMRKYFNDSDDYPYIGEIEKRTSLVLLNSHFSIAHPNIRLFITHGGLLSTQEALDRGVPVVGIPVFADQFLNSNRAVLAGYGIRLDYSNVTEESLLWAVKEVIDNPKYRENALHISRIYKDQPLSPLETAVYWTEYVIRHKGAPHMRSASLDLAWYQYFLLDVIAVLALFAGILLLVPVLILRFLFKKCFGAGTTSKSRESIKKKRN
ncbi:hypothetical protein C0J52_11770 [Blattella germanica]|nr:hypothetical protein C0J52_11770 [Blattella germanica]